jgi:hypothetical protein
VLDDQRPATLPDDRQADRRHQDQAVHGDRQQHRRRDRVAVLQQQRPLVIERRDERCRADRAQAEPGEPPLPPARGT